jgi:hypothetical protein
MSVNSVTSRIRSVQREIESLNSKMVSETGKEATNTKRIASLRGSINTNTSASSLQSKYRDIQRLESENGNIQARKAEITRRIADKTAELYRHQNDLYKEQATQQSRAISALRNAEDQARGREAVRLNTLRAAVPSAIPPSTGSSGPIYDAFISHASDDKEELVRPLAEQLRARGFRVWYDEFELKVGDSLRRKIDSGLSRSRFGIVVLSPAFFSKNWPQYELDGLVAKEIAGGKVILPIWHKVSKDEVMKYSPTLADKFALSTSLYTVTDLSTKLDEVLRGS